MDSHLLKTKSIEQLVSDVEHGGKSLKRSLTAWDLTLLGIGAIIGTGIFVLTGTAAANQAGPAIVVSYLAAGLACGFAALCYAEFASMVPIGWSGYMQRLLAGAGINLPLWMSAAPSAATPGTLINLPAVIIVLIMMVLL